MGPPLSIHSLVGSNGIKAILTCHKGIEHRARAVDELELMDMDEAATTEAKPKAAAKEEAEQEETITVIVADYQAMQQTLAVIQFELTDMQRDARQDKLKADERYHALQAMLQAILAWLPPASGATSSAPQ
jgi:organic radical activating enzyme